jgi:Kef-type K+ transport system membrane component KefB
VQGDAMLTGQILLQLVAVLLVVQLLGSLCKRIGQQWVIGEILAGLALGPSLLGMLWPDLKSALFPVNTLPTLETLGDIGLAIYMFSLGARLDTHLMLRQSSKAMFVAISCMLLPFSIGTLLAFLLYPSLAGSKATLFSFVLIVGTSVSITAFPVLARLLSEKQMLHTKIGILALTSACIGDVLAWCLLSFAESVIHSQGIFTLAATTIGITLLFAIIMLFVVRPLLYYLTQHIQSQQFAFICVIVMFIISSYLTNAIGINFAFGAFVAGIIVPRNGAFTSQIRGLDQMNNLLFLPLFFVSSGLRTQVGLIQGPTMWLTCLLILVIACLGKIVGGTLSGCIIGEPWRDAFCLGGLMNTRGLVELIVLNIGLELKVLSPTLFAMLVIMAVLTTVMTSPLLSLVGYRSEGTPAAHGDPVEQLAR